MTTHIYTIDELEDLIVENQLTPDDIQTIIDNQNIVAKLKREKALWEEPMDSSFSNEIRRSVLRTLTEILEINTTSRSKGNA